MKNAIWIQFTLFLGLISSNCLLANPVERVNHQSLRQTERFSPWPTPSSYSRRDGSLENRPQPTSTVQPQHRTRTPRWTPNHQELLKKTVIFAGYELALMYGLSKLPESITNWEPHKRKVKQWPGNWRQNVTSSPVFDGDHIAMNFIAHPWAGAGYYQMARFTGLSPTQSFAYSFIQSAFIWEYGFESLIERPSVQDILITPSLGSLLGELEYRLVRRIQAQNEEVLGSKVLGKISIALLNPFDSLVEATRRLFDRDPNMHVMTNFTMNPRHDNKRFLFQLHIDT